MRHVAGGLLLFVLSSRTAAAQGLPRIALAPANAALDADFVGLNSLRELSDGRVILTDGRDQRIFLADFTAKTASALSRQGKGPMEYSFVGLLHATRGDSTVMMDVSNRRWLLFDGPRVAGTVPADHPAVQAAAPMRGADRLGRVLGTRSEEFTSGVRLYTRKDSQVVVLVDRRTGRADTVARVREMPRQATMTRDATGQVTSASTMPTESYAQAEEPYLCNDGTLVVVRLEPLRVDWRAPDGTWTRGEPLPLAGQDVGPAERDAILKRRATMAETMRNAGMPEPPQGPMPKTLPALESLRPLELPDGRIALKRRSPASNPSSRYVIVNRKGKPDGEISLASNELLAGFGRKSVYVSFKDADDVQRLRRHPWP